MLAISAVVIQSEGALALIQTGTARTGGGVKVAGAPTPSSTRFNAWVVRDTVENYWGRAANLNFSGWGTCDPRAEPNLPPGHHRHPLVRRPRVTSIMAYTYC